MKTTTTLYDYLQSELINNGYDEFTNNNQLTFFEADFSFMQKMLNYDKDVQEIVNKQLFKGIKLDNEENDILFKRTFLNRFLNRQIAFQTVEAFTSQVVYTTLYNLQYMNSIYNNLDDFISNKTNNTGSDNGTNVNDNRFLSSSLPQSQVNLNVENTQLDYGDTNTISKNKTTNTGQNQSESNTMSLDNLIKTKALFEEIFIEFDSKCFLQIW